MNKSKLILLFWFTLIVAVLAVIAINVGMKRATAKNKTANTAGVNTVTLENTYNQIAGVMNRITVSIYDGSAGQAQPQLLGSGVIISEQCILTNLHVVENRPNLFVTAYAPQLVSYPVILSRRDPAGDLAILQAANNAGFPVTGIPGNSDAVDVGDIVFAMGNAFGKGNLLTSGMIIDKGYSYTVSGQAYNSMFRTNINNYPGTCGGPLVNIRGEIIGINNSAGYTANNYMGIGYATPINKAIALLSNNISGQMLPAPAGAGNPAMPAAFMDAYSLV